MPPETKIYHTNLGDFIQRGSMSCVNNDFGKLYLEGSWAPDVCLHSVSTALLYNLHLLKTLCENSLWSLTNPFNYLCCNFCKNLE